QCKSLGHAVKQLPIPLLAGAQLAQPLFQLLASSQQLCVLAPKLLACGCQLLVHQLQCALTHCLVMSYHVCFQVLCHRSLSLAAPSQAGEGPALLVTCSGHHCTMLVPQRQAVGTSHLGQPPLAPCQVQRMLNCRCGVPDT